MQPDPIDASPTTALALTVIESLRTLLHDPGFVCRHKTASRYFTRKRKLTFLIVNLLILQKTLKSVTNHLHEFWERLCLHVQMPLSPATAGAWTQARAKLSATAFIELNAQAVLAPFYAQQATVKSWLGHRVLACDGSLAELPASQELAREFGEVQTSNQHGSCGVDYPQARISVLYDVINRLALDAAIAPYRTGEMELALGHLEHLRSGDLTLWDRGYPSFELFARLTARGAHFVARCSRGSFGAAQELFKLGRGGVDRQVTLRAHPNERAQLVGQQLPVEIVVRFVTVELSTGEIEVLATSLLDEGIYPREVFGELYHLRWGVETFYHTLKSHLEVENFSGETLGAVRQDFYAMIFIANLESVLTAPAQEQLSQGDSGRSNPSKVNRAVSFHRLKSHIIELCCSDLPAQEILGRLTLLFAGAPTCVRGQRNAPRMKLSVRRSLRFQRRVKKVVY